MFVSQEGLSCSMLSSGQSLNTIAQANLLRLFHPQHFKQQLLLLLLFSELLLLQVGCDGHRDQN